MLDQVVVGNPRRLEPRWDHRRLNQFLLLVVVDVDGAGAVPTSDAVAASLDICLKRWQWRRW